MVRGTRSAEAVEGCGKVLFLGCEFDCTTWTVGAGWGSWSNRCSMPPSLNMLIYGSMATEQIHRFALEWS